MCEADQVVGRRSHRGDDRDHAVAGLARRDTAAGDALQPLGVADGGAAELHHDEAGRALRALDGGDGFVVGQSHSATV